MTANTKISKAEAQIPSKRYFDIAIAMDPFVVTNMILVNDPALFRRASKQPWFTFRYAVALSRLGYVANLTDMVPPEKLAAYAASVAVVHNNHHLYDDDPLAPFDTQFTIAEATGADYLEPSSQSSCALKRFEKYDPAKNWYSL